MRMQVRSGNGNGRYRPGLGDSWTEPKDAAEEQARINAVIAVQAQALTQWQQQQQSGMKAANDVAEALARRANGLLCAGDSRYCGSNPCFADANRDNPGLINSNWDHLGVSCAGYGFGNKRVWFPKTASPDDIARRGLADIASYSPLPTVQAQPIQTAQAQPVPAPSQLQMAQPMAQTYSPAAPPAYQPPPAPNAPGSSTARTLDLDGLLAESGGVKLGGMELSPLMLIGAGLVLVMVMKGNG